MKGNLCRDDSSSQRHSRENGNPAGRSQSLLGFDKRTGSFRILVDLRRNELDLHRFSDYSKNAKVRNKKI